jgi:hypothetical protein
LSVEPLTPEESRELARALLIAAEQPQVAAPAQLDAIARESGGNPFFVQELVQYLGTTSAVEHAAGPGTVSLGPVLWARVQRLPEDARRLLEVVAVAGQPLPLTVACQAAQVGTDVDAALASLRAGRLIRSTGTGEAATLETYHDRIRETVVAHLAPEVRRDLHGRLAQVLEETGAADPEVLASHFLRSDQQARAGRYYAQAAAQAAEALAFDRAATLFRMALDLGATAGAGERPLRARLADALANAGRGAEAAREYLAACAGTSAEEVLELRRRAAMQLLISGHIDEGLATLRLVVEAVGMHLPSSPRRAFVSFLARRLQLWWRGLRFRLRDPGAVPAADLTRIEICWSAATGLGLVDPIQGGYFQTLGLLQALRAGEAYHLARSLAIEAAYVSIGGGRTEARTARLLEQAETLARQVDHPHALGAVTLARGLAAAFVGRWPQARDLCDWAEAILRERCTGALWEIVTAQRFALWALMFMGDVREIARRLPALLRAAQERDDRYAMLNVCTIARPFVRLAANQPQRARRELAEAIGQWSQQGYHVQHMNRLFDEAQIDLYLGEGQAAWQRLVEQWPTLQRSHLLRVQQVRIFLLHLRARGAVAAAAEAKDARPLWKATERDARALRKERMAWSDALAGLIDAAVAAHGGKEAAAVAHLREAVAAFDGLSMRLYAAVARRRLGKLLGGDEGCSLVAQAEAWMAGQKILNSERMTGMLAPGFVDAGSK